MREAFNYCEDYRIPQERFTSIFGEIEGKQKYNKEKHWSGSCFGMCVSAALFFAEILNYKEFDINARCVHDLSVTTNLTELIEEYQLAQGLKDVIDEHKRNFLQLSNMLNAVRNFEETGSAPIILGLKSYSFGHAVLPYRVVDNPDGSFSIYVYDCNYPDDASRIVTVNKDRNYCVYSGETALAMYCYAEHVHDAIVAAKMRNIEDM